MIHLSTGTPGSGKTLNLLQLVEHECKGRNICYRGIKDLTLPWQLLTDDEVHQWFTFPTGTVFVLDEVQQIWPRVPHTRGTPESVERLDTHRHNGYDFYIVTQANRLLDSKVESFIDRHYHYVRSSGFKYTKRFAWEEFCKDPSSSTARKNAQVSRIPFNKKTFAQYKSAEIHTGGMRIPKPLIYLALCIIILIGIGYKLSLRAEELVNPNGGEVASVQAYDPAIELVQADEVIPMEYNEKWTPRIQGIPHTAPAYDEVTTVKTYPRPQCWLRVRNGECRCFTQQATPLDIDYDSCLAIVDGGWFNPFVEDVSTVAEGPAKHEPEPGPLVESDNQDATRPRITVIPSRNSRMQVEPLEDSRRS